MEQGMYENYIEEMYENITVLSTGNTGRTFLAKHRGSGKIVVKKYIPVQTGSIYQKLKEIFSPNLAKVYEVCVCQNYCLIIEEYISGETLETILEERKVLTEEVVTTYVIQILKALQTVHSQGIVHRDLTPANILISTDNVPKLIDFGISRNQKENQNQDTMILGTLGYASPEQFGFRQTDNRADIYALGIIINKMLTGKLPNEKLTSSRKYKKIVEKCLQLDPDKRYQWVEQILAELGEPDFEEVIWKRDKSMWPGFRKGVTWRKVVAVIGYSYILLSFIIMVPIGEGGVAGICQRFTAMVLFWILPVVMLTNLGRWDSRTKFLRKIPKSIRVVLRIILALTFMVLGTSILW